MALYQQFRVRQTEIEGSDQDTVRAAGICSGDTLWLLSAALENNGSVLPTAAQKTRVPALQTPQLSGPVAKASAVGQQRDAQPAVMECQALAEQQADDVLQQLPEVVCACCQSHCCSETIKPAAAGNQLSAGPDNHGYYSALTCLTCCRCPHK